MSERTIKRIMELAEEIRNPPTELVRLDGPERLEFFRGKIREINNLIATLTPDTALSIRDSLGAGLSSREGFLDCCDEMRGSGAVRSDTGIGEKICDGADVHAMGGDPPPQQPPIGFSIIIIDAELAMALAELEAELSEQG